MKYFLPHRQEFWVSVGVAIAIVILMIFTPIFASTENIFNISRNIAFIAIVALGQTVVIISGGIDLSVGSVIGLSAIVTGTVLESGCSFIVGLASGLGAALLCGIINGVLIARAGLSSFVVTLGMLSVVRSLTMVLAQNRMIYQFGTAESSLVAFGGGELIGIPTPVIVLGASLVIFTFVLRYTALGLHCYAIGSSENSARLCGVRVSEVKIFTYMTSAFMAGLTGVMMVGWLGSVTSAIGSGQELTVVAAAVIGGANLAGGLGSAYGAVIGSVLIEVIRNGLLLIGVDPYWQGTFVGFFIIFAVLLERIQARSNY